MSNGKRDSNKTILIYFIFAVVMSYLESAIVVYLRTIFYPDGFHFPLKIITNKIAVIEIGREAATLIMLWLVAQMHRGETKEKLALFIFTFALWDLFYYFWLKVFLNWPAGWFDWDILFLIPAPWVAPWSAPALVALTLTTASLLVLKYPERFGKFILSKTEWLVEIVAGLVILYSFFYETENVLAGSIPYYYPWWILIVGLALGLAVFSNRFFNYPFRKKQ